MPAKKITIVVAADDENDLAAGIEHALRMVKGDCAEGKFGGGDNAGYFMVEEDVADGDLPADYHPQKPSTRHR